LESDPIFKEANVTSLKECSEDGAFEKQAYDLFDKLSSGHKIILLTITKLVQTVEEKSLIFLDEPEGHLHPPLLFEHCQSC
jgi:predicted ATPase